MMPILHVNLRVDHSNLAIIFGKILVMSYLPNIPRANGALLFILVLSFYCWFNK